MKSLCKTDVRHLVVCSVFLDAEVDREPVPVAPPLDPDLLRRVPDHGGRVDGVQEEWASEQSRGNGAALEHTQ